MLTSMDCNLEAKLDMFNLFWICVVYLKSWSSISIDSLRFTLCINEYQFPIFPLLDEHDNILALIIWSIIKVERRG